jgi:predicted dehydrogenase
LAVVGAGQRGTLYARIARRLGAKIASVANPGATRRDRFGDEFDLPPNRRYATWQEMLEDSPAWDAVVVASPDTEHAEPGVAALEQGHHLLLEKPLATNPAAASQLAAAAAASGKVTAVCHVLRYSPSGRALADTIRQGLIGQVTGITHFQPIGWWHFAHSFVRGSWRSQADGSSLLEAMGVHDIDWVAGLVQAPVERVISFGSLQHFRPEHRPPGAADRCQDCPAEPTCPYSAVRIYGRFLDHPLYSDWPLRVVTPEATPAALAQALRTGPYGQCVYLGLNDVVDHQTVNLELAGGAVIDVTLSAFWEMAARSTRVLGTRGCLEYDGQHLSWFDFASGERRDITPQVSGDAGGVYASGDEGLIRAFLEAVRAEDPSLVPSSVAESHRTLKLVWAAEQARCSGRVISLAGPN